jgi:histidine triad (HIT) family protein
MCLFCNILGGREPGYFVYRDEHVSAILDKYPITPGHTLVMPNRHFADLLVTDPEISCELTRKTVFLARSIRDALKASGVRILTNVGASSGQVVFHTHVHIIPSWDSDPPQVFPSFQPRKAQAPSYYESLQKVISQYIKSITERGTN